MAREGIDGRRLEIANELIAQAIPRAQSDRDFPAWVRRTLSADRRFGSRDRRHYRELIYTAVRFLPWVASVPVDQRARAALWLSSDGPGTRDARMAAFPEAVETAPEIDSRATAFNHTFPAARAEPANLVPAWVQEECPALLEPHELAIMNSRAPLWLRIPPGNLAPATVTLAAEGIAIEPDRRVPGAARVTAGPDVTRSKAYADGLVEVQDIGSQWVLNTASPVAGETWLDACAGAGGKTLQLTSLVGSDTRVVAHDVRASALAELRFRAARAGVTSIEITPRPSGNFDAVLVDAPCSGSGTWRRSPHLKWQTSAGDVERAADTQIRLLETFSKLVRPGGRLVYATCSIATTENEAAIRKFLSADPEFTANTPGSDPLGATLLPSVLDSDGYFVSVLRRGRE